MSGVAVVGSGTMGRAIAAGFVRSGMRTMLVSRDPANAGPAPAGVDLVGALPDEAPNMVVEAIPEDLAMKIALFRSVETRYDPASAPLMASNTSGLPLQDIADRLARPDRFLGIHWFHPAADLPMVEAVRVAETTPDTLDTAIGLLHDSGWDSIVVPRPIPGAVVNRLQHAILHEAYHLMAEGLATVEDIDRAARWLLGPRMCIAGLLEQKDLAGLTGHILAQRSIVPDLCHNVEPNAAVQAMLERGETGALAGRGFYDWNRRDANEAIATAATLLRQLIAYLDDHARGTVFR
ncbi:3-hydroxyacyl-CoA dehydrogenase NAD-binding domain-containing protein [Aurantimonas sp. A2-1-M11]|uniref:3-hydroxyacyl-CoA dehydrogenase family protein n=1 Tax=Aurantimonas sp. A2-1-M11 TaxID=3113712 RepID=UPI002F924E63